MFFGEARIPDGVRVYAIGDVHGYAGLLASLFAQIDAELADDPPEDYRIVTLGDYCDRGPDSRAVLDALIARRAADPRLVCLKGNHDDWMVRMLTEPHRVGLEWLTWGGRETLASYGVGTPEAIPAADLAPLARQFGAALPDEHRSFVEGLPLTHVEGDYCFVHAGLRPHVALGDQRMEDLIWIREPFLSHAGSFGKVAVHGHTIHERPTVLPNRIAVDTGVYRSGLLTAAVLEADRCRFICAHPGGIARIAP